MSFDFNNNVPIYVQIIEYIKRQIIIGIYRPNEKIPSVRELSIQFQVNPNTIQKALGELERQGLLFTERTNGKYVTHDEKIILKAKSETLGQIMDEFCDTMSKFGIDKQQVIKMLKEKE